MGGRLIILLGDRHTIRPTTIIHGSRDLSGTWRLCTSKRTQHDISNCLVPCNPLPSILKPHPLILNIEKIVFLWYVTVYGEDLVSGGWGLLVLGGGDY